MHIPTHILSGWCIGNLLPLTPRERFFCMIAAAGADLDGVGYAISEELYWDYHHKLGHCAAFGVLSAAAMAWFSRRRMLAFVVYLSLFHLHLVLDYFGSGPGWPIYYGWPVSDREWENPRAWAFFSWQNIGAAFALLAWTAWIAVRYRRTPLERIKPSLERKAIAWIDRRRGARTDTRMKDDHEDRLPGRGAPQRDAAPAVAGSDRSP
jgi:hypothetical protein